MGWTEMAATLSAEFGTQRTAGAVKMQARKYGIALRPAEPIWSQNMMLRFFCCTTRALNKAERLGMLEMQRGAVTRPGWARGGGEWRIRESAVEAFIRSYPWAYDARCLHPRTHRLAQLARALQVRDPYVTGVEGARLLGLSSKRFMYWSARGLIRPTGGRVLGAVGAPELGTMVFLTSEVHLLGQELVRRRAEQLRGATARIVQYCAPKRQAA
jgi:hypothetical protein